MLMSLDKKKLYIMLILCQLSNSGYGCHIAGVYEGALSYADDIRQGGVFSPILFNLYCVAVSFL